MLDFGLLKSPEMFLGLLCLILQCDTVSIASTQTVSNYSGFILQRKSLSPCNCSMHHFHKFANLFCPFFRSLCTKTRQPGWDALAWGTSVPFCRLLWLPLWWILGAILWQSFANFSNVWLAHDARWEIEYNTTNDFFSRAESLESLRSRYWQLMPHRTFLMSLGSFSIFLSRWGSQVI